MTTINLQITASDDDAREHGVGASRTAASAYLTSTARYATFRFDGVALDQGESVTSAYLSVYLNTTDSDSPNGATVYAEDVDDSPIINFTSGYIAAMVPTTAVTTWNGVDIGSGWASIDVTAIVQEIVDRPGWVSGNAIHFVIRGAEDSVVSIMFYDGSTAQAAKLDIVYAGLQTVEMPYLSNPATLYAPTSITAAAGATLEMPYIDASATLYTGMAAVGTWKIESITHAHPGNVNLYEMPIAASAATGRAAVIYVATAGNTFLEPYGLTAEGNNGAWSYIGGTSRASAWATGDIDAAGDSVTIRANGELNFYYINLTLVVLSGVDTGRWIETAVTTGNTNATPTELTTYYPTNSAVLGFSWTRAVASISQTPDAGFFSPTGPYDTYSAGSANPYQSSLVYLKPVAGGASDTETISATIVGAPSSVVHIGLLLPGIQGDFYPPYLDAAATLYPPERVYLDTAQIVDMPYLDATADVNPPAVVLALAMPYLDATAVLYEPEVTQGAGPVHYIELPYLGRGVPIVVNGAYLDATATLYEPDVTLVLGTTMPYINAAVTLYAPTIAAVTMYYGGVYAPTEIAHV